MEEPVSNVTRPAPNDTNTTEDNTRHELFAMPPVFLRLIVVDDDLDVDALKRHLLVATTGYLEQSFQNMDSLFHDNIENKQEEIYSFESMQIEWDRFDRAFLGITSTTAKQEQPEQDEPPPTSMILASLKGTLTYKEQAAKHNEDDIQRMETMIQTTMRYALEEKLDLLLHWYHDHDPMLLRVVAQSQAYVDETAFALYLGDLEGQAAATATQLSVTTKKTNPMNDESYDDDEEDNEDDQKWKLSFVKEQQEYLLWIALVAAFLFMAAGTCMMIGVCQIRRAIEKQTHLQRREQQQQHRPAVSLRRQHQQQRDYDMLEGKSIVVSSHRQDSMISASSFDFYGFGDDHHDDGSDEDFASMSTLDYLEKGVLRNNPENTIGKMMMDSFFNQSHTTAVSSSDDGDDDDNHNFTNNENRQDSNDWRDEWASKFARFVRHKKHREDEQQQHRRQRRVYEDWSSSLDSSSSSLCSF
ncbi:hypothetical protein ACA910_008606 [Epithemia clementina (nom. ined.)]